MKAICIFGKQARQLKSDGQGMDVVQERPKGCESVWDLGFKRHPQVFETCLTTAFSSFLLRVGLEFPM